MPHVESDCYRARIVGSGVHLHGIDVLRIMVRSEEIRVQGDVEAARNLLHYNLMGAMAGDRDEDSRCRDLNRDLYMGIVL